MYTLRFALHDVHRLAEHAASCTKHTPSYTQIFDGVQEGQPALEWVNDFGIYLLSNGIPQRKLDPDDPDSDNDLVYAEGWAPDSEQDSADVEEIGGDDFCVQLELGTPLSNGRTLLDLIRAAHAKGMAWFLVCLDADRISYRFERPGVTTPHP